MDEASGDVARNRFAVVVAGLVGAFFLAFGLWQFLGPESFFASVAPWEPYNEHFIRDLGSAWVGIGAVLLLTVSMAGHGALLPVLLGTGIGAALHVISHLIDGDADPFLTLVALLLLGAAAVTWRARLT